MSSNMNMLGNLTIYSSISEIAICQKTLRNHVEAAVNNYFMGIGEVQPVNFYELVLTEIEPPLLAVVMRKTRGNQTKAAKMLGLSRGTLRKKLKQYHFIDC